jgi:hypothetical protein
MKIPNNRDYEYAYNQSYQLAIDQLSKINDYPELCRKSDCKLKEFKDQKYIELEYLGQACQIILGFNEKPHFQIKLLNGDGEISLKERILVLHYILNARGTPLSNTLITFKELPEGPVYFRTFSQRTIKHLVNYFGKDPLKIIDASQKLGGRQSDYGDTSVTINAFTRLPVTLVLWHGDAEFPAEGNILYDSTITDYLPTEDIIVLTETLAWKLVNITKN